MAAIAWYGPLLDLSQASSRGGDYVQLLVFVHSSRPIQKHKSPNANEEASSTSRTDIHVGDDTRSYFSVSIWHKHMASSIFSGDIILLQNVKIVKYGDVFGATTVQLSSLLQLVHPYELLTSRGTDELLMDCKVGRTTKKKLKRVIEWVLRARSTLHCLQQTHPYQKNLTMQDIQDKFIVGSSAQAWQKEQLPKNWQQQEERKSKECISISEVSCLTDSCNAIFYARVDDIYLPFTWKPIEGHDKEGMLISKRFCMMEDGKIVQDLICAGCKLCGTPIDSGSSPVDQNTVPFYCKKSSNYVHVVGFIYRPFLLCVRDQSGSIPLLVKNRGAEVLFGNISAESVYACFLQQQKKGQIPDSVASLRGMTRSKASEVEIAASVLSLRTYESQQGGNAGSANNKGDRKRPNFHNIWLILLKLLLQKGNNIPVGFEVAVDCGLRNQNGRFELLTLTMPCHRTDGHDASD